MRCRIAPILLLFLTSHLSATHPQRSGLPQDTLAMVGDEVITARDLIERLEFMPFEEKTRERDFATVKRRAVESLVGERLLVNRYRAGDGHEEWRMNVMQDVLLKMFARDEFFKRAIRDSVSVSSSEMDDGMRRIVSRNRIIVIRPSDGADVRAFLRAWRKTPGDRQTLLASSGFEHDTMYISYGSTDPGLEESAYRLRSSMDISGPVPSSLFGPVLVVLLDRTTKKELTSIPKADLRSIVSSTIRGQKETVRLHSVLEGLLRGQSMTADSVLFGTVVKSLRTAMLTDTAVRAVAAGYRPLPSDLYAVQNSLRAQADRPVVTGSFGSVSVGEFLESMQHYDITIPSLEPKRFASSMFGMVRTAVQAEVAAQEAMRRGFHRAAEVSRDVRLWTGYWKSRYAEYAVTETVTVHPGDAWTGVWTHDNGVIKRSASINIREILHDDSATASGFYRAIRNGASMDSLARLFSRRSMWRERGGVSGWFRYQDDPELFERSFGLPEGEAQPPTRMSTGFVVLQLLGRRFELPKTTVDSLLAREALRIRQVRQQDAVNEAVATEAIASNVQIFYDNIDRTEVRNINNLVRRTIGFGGLMNAAPVLIPQWQWVEQWEAMKQLVP